MNSVYFNSDLGDQTRRDSVFNGQVFIFSPRPSTLAFCEFAHEMLTEAFNGLDPRKAQYEMPVEDFVAIMAPLKPKFIHHPKSKELVKQILADLQCDLEKTYMDVPRLKIITHGGYLTAGVGYPFHPHRDTWYSAPFCQLNWWLPIYDIQSESSMAFHPYYWDYPVRNSSNEFNYYEYNSTGRKNAGQHVKSDTRKQPRVQEEFTSEPQIRLVCPAGGLILFSGAQMHSTVPNTSGLTRYSIDFRTLHYDDVAAQRGAPNIDSAATGTALRDFLRCTDFASLPAEVIGLYEEETPAGAELVFKPF